jgi:glycosyltransferase involved in cell wall biosynthesis
MAHLNIHVVGIFYLMSPHQGSEHGIGWQWAQQLCRIARQVTVILPEDEFQALSQNITLPANLQLVSSGKVKPRKCLCPFPSYFLRFSGFLVQANSVAKTLSADIFHQFVWGTPFWGSSIKHTSGKRLLGPFGVSSPPPFWALNFLSFRSWCQEILRQSMLSFPWEPLTAKTSITSADHCIIQDSESAKLCARSHAEYSWMMQDGASPIQSHEITPHEKRRDLIWAGRLLPRKCPQAAIQAFARAAPRLPKDVRLLILGGGPEHPKVLQLIHRLNLQTRIVSVGSVTKKQTQDYLRNCIALVFSSLRDSFGGIIFEAAEKATPIITGLHRGVAGLQRWAPAESMWGRQVHSASDFIDCLADGMVSSTTCSENDWAAKSNAALKFAQQHSWHARGDQLALLYRRILSS